MPAGDPARRGRLGLGRVEQGRVEQILDGEGQRQWRLGQREGLLIGQQQRQVGAGVVVGGEERQPVQVALGGGQLQGERRLAAIRAAG